MYPLSRMLKSTNESDLFRSLPSFSSTVVVVSEYIKQVTS